MAKVIRIASGIELLKKQFLEDYTAKVKELDEALSRKRREYRKSIWGLIKLAFLELFGLHEEVRKKREFEEEFYRRLRLCHAGEEGEKEAEKFFENNLPDSYICFAGVPMDMSDIDFLIVGLTGVYLVETKNYKGVVTLRDGKLYHYKISRKGRIYEGHGDISSEITFIKSSIYKLKNLIVPEIGFDFFVRGVLFFVNSEAKVEVPDNEYTGIYVCDRETIVNKLLGDRTISEKKYFELKNQFMRYFGQINHSSS